MSSAPACLNLDGLPTVIDYAPAKDTSKQPFELTGAGSLEIEDGQLRAEDENLLLNDEFLREQGFCSVDEANKDIEIFRNTLHAIMPGLTEEEEYSFVQGQYGKLLLLLLTDDRDAAKRNLKAFCICPFSNTKKALFVPREVALKAMREVVQ